ncbi:MAG: glycerophosphodiester phosphodiesterase family protein [Rubrivivax sp.]
MKMNSFKRIGGIVGVTAACLFTVPGASWAAAPIVIAHRGASGYLPERTLAAYELAVRMGANYIEPDLQFTSDNKLVAIHDDTLQRTTNVSSLFATRKGGYRVSDFSLARRAPARRAVDEAPPDRAASGLAYRAPSRIEKVFAKAG